MNDVIHLVVLDSDDDCEILGAFINQAKATAWLHEVASTNPDQWEPLTTNSYRRIMDDGRQECLWINSYYINDAHD